ncbi:hypothetical protein Y032_0637g956 [Ancylostoma ceylanicum]|uniref:Uncharacterized protein n=1 Tax=Ancylostoma ceylanicum TaxID=53326 RepID=A0A016WKU0_9BILA|nr:hypothetical protein Y032_0637g956 [Ancylostoma ceylanicum]
MTWGDIHIKLPLGSYFTIGSTHIPVWYIYIWTLTTKAYSYLEELHAIPDNNTCVLDVIVNWIYGSIPENTNYMGYA